MRWSALLLSTLCVGSLWAFSEPEIENKRDEDPADSFYCSLDFLDPKTNPSQSSQFREVSLSREATESPIFTLSIFEICRGLYRVSIHSVNGGLLNKESRKLFQYRLWYSGFQSPRASSEFAERVHVTSNPALEPASFLRKELILMFDEKVSAHPGLSTDKLILELSGLD